MINNSLSVSPTRHIERVKFAVGLILISLTLAACATRPYSGVDVGTASFLERGITQQQQDLVITAAVPDAEETEQLTGLDLYEQGIQPVWIKVENRGDERARAVLWSIDKEYFSPIEVAYMNRKKFSAEGYEDMQRWFYENGLPRFIPPGKTRSGLVFTHLRPGTKGFNLTVIQDRETHDFTFFVPLPGFVADFMEVDFANLYEAADLREFSDLPSLRKVLETELPCCATDPSGKLQGGPFNVVLVGSGLAVRRAMMRGDWLETSAEAGVLEKARQQSFNGRKPDAIFRQERLDGNERIQLHLWLSSWKAYQEPVWVGQVYYFSEEQGFLNVFDPEVVRNSGLLSFFVNESVMADADSAQRFLMQNLWYNGSLKMAGFIEGVGRAPIDQPRQSFGGAAYFTEGQRFVGFLSEKPVAFDETLIRFEDRQRAILGGPEQ